MSVPAIDRRSGLTCAEFRRDYLEPRKPVIIRDALDGCAARQRWTPEYFMRRFGDREVVTDQGNMRMADMIGKLADGDVPPPFLRERPLPWLFPEILPDLDPYPFAARPNWLEYPFARWPDVTRRGFAAMLIRLAQTDLNLTGANVRFPYLHLDRFRCHATILQWYGRKEFFVFPPSETDKLYIKPGQDVSAISDVENVDLQRYPRFAQAKMLRFTLHPGELLFNPSGWWHTTRTLDVSIATVISFANASNWMVIVRNMFPRYWKGRAVFLPYALYLLALGWFRLPFWSGPDAADPASAAAAMGLFNQRKGAWIRRLPESKY